MANTLWPTILLLGKNGQVGWELRRTLAPLGQVIAMDQRDLDFTKPDEIRTQIRRIKPNLIVNAAAYTAVDRAEEEPDLAMMINAIAPGVLAEEAKILGAPLVHYSTDYVFDGTKKTPYTEEDKPSPLNIYGITKLEGERAIQAVNGNYLIFRTSWVYGMRGSNFLLTILQLAKERDELRIVNDQIGAPTWCRMLAEATALILARGYERLEGKWGLYHLTAGGKASWFDFAETILASELVKERRIIRLLPCSSSEYNVRARRPKNSVLSNNYLEKNFNIALPLWQDCFNMAAKYEQAGREN